jgi:hypothetical protein
MVTRPIRTFLGLPFFYPCPMDLPPSGWYPDPYGTPSLLRWWDGSVWTQHTHPDVTAVGSGGEPAATVLQSAVQSTAVQGAAGPGTGMQATTVQPAAQTSGLQATTVQPSAGQPNTEWLRRTKPPTGQPTAPQPALPTDPVAAAAAAAAAAASGVAPTAYQPAVTTAQPGGVQPTAFQPAAGQPGGMQTVAMQPTPPPLGAGAGTQVLYGGGDPWQTPGMPGGPGGPAGFGGPMQGNPYGYQEVQRRRRRRLMGGLAAGTVAAIAAIAIIVANLGGSPATPAAVAQSPTTPPPPPTASAPSPTASASPTASPTATTGQSTLNDSQSGLSYTQLSSPWQATASCPSTLNSVQAFPWTDGEYAVAGQVNGNNGPMTWYGEACSGPLPLQYGYSGTQDLQSVAENLASTFENAYYNPLDHNISQGNDNPIQVSGHAAWEVTYDVTYTNASGQGAGWTDEEAAVVVVDTGTDEPAVFFTSVPYTLNEANISTLVSSLQLTSTPSGGNPQPGGNQPSDGANP